MRTRAIQYTLPSLLRRARQEGKRLNMRESAVPFIINVKGYSIVLICSRRKKVKEKKEKRWKMQEQFYIVLNAN